MDRLDWIGWIWLDDSHFQCLYWRLLCHGCDGRRSRLILGKKLGDSKSQIYRVFDPLVGGHPQPLKGALNYPKKSHKESLGSSVFLRIEFSTMDYSWLIDYIRSEIVTLSRARSPKKFALELTAVSAGNLSYSQKTTSAKCFFQIICILYKYQNISEC